MDFVFVSFNSEQWIKNCFLSIVNLDYNLKEINIWVVDNCSTDASVQRLNEIKSMYGAKFGTFEIIQAKSNLGFGRANNLGAARGNNDIIGFFNIDTEFYSDTLKKLQLDIECSDENVALWELRQFPYEHPKLYDALTHETSWSSGAAFAVRRNVYEKLGGFDEAIFMYAEDVDLSWRLRSFGYKLRYVPSAVIRHYAYKEAGELKPNQHINSVINNLLLRYRFAGLRTIIAGHGLFWRCLMGTPAFPGSKKLLFSAYVRHFFKIWHFIDKRRIGRSKDFIPTFLGFDYAGLREGAFYENEFPDTTPLVSIIVRTCGRPDVLRETLLSLRQQTYDNIEIVVVEDGEEKAGGMIHKEFSDLNILYQSTGTKVGRSKAGNLAMSLAHGKYLNFLDDDDLFFADHIEVLVHDLEKSKNKAAYAFAFETPIEVKCKEPYLYVLGDYNGVHKQKFDKIMLCHHNYIPIQCIMFAKELFEKYGGLDETLDVLEDWDLWVRYSQYTNFDCIEKTTSIYRVPMNQEINQKRQKELDDALLIVRNKHKNYIQRVSVYELAQLYEGRKMI